MKVFWLITLAVCFGYIRNMFPKVVKAAKDSYGECYFKCKNSIECHKGAGNFVAPLVNAICAKLIQITAQNVCVMNIEIKIPQWGNKLFIIFPNNK